MKSKKAVLLLEVAIVVLVVSIISLFLFRGYGLFIKAGKRSSNYMKLLLHFEEKIWDLRIKEKNNELSVDDIQGKFSLSDVVWNLSANDTEYTDLKECTLRIEDTGRKPVFLDTVLYFAVQKEE